MNAYRFTTEIKQDHTIVVPDDIPQGTAEVLVLVKEARKNGSVTPLRGTPYRFEDPFSPAADVQEWNACR